VQRKDPRAPIVGCIVVLACLWLLSNYSFVFFVRSNPEPNDFIAVEGTDCPMPPTDAGRIDWHRRMDFLKAQAWMIGISLKVPIGFARLLLYSF
jgi:hypothetical protein